MAFELRWTRSAIAAFADLEKAARSAAERRKRTGASKASKQEGLFRQVAKAIELLANDPRHPGLQTHEYRSIPHPFERDGKVFEAYAQNRTPGACRVFWCYGPDRGQLTIIAITPHP